MATVEESGLLFREPITLSERDELLAILRALRAVRDPKAPEEHIGATMSFREMREIVAFMAQREEGISRRWLDASAARRARALDSVFNLLLAIDLDYEKIKPILARHAGRLRKAGGFS